MLSPYYNGLMIVKAIQTPRVKPNYDLFALLRDSIRSLEEKSVVVVTSKIVSLCEGSVVPVKEGTVEEKHELIKKDADAYLDASFSKWNLILAIKHNSLAMDAGIDVSNTGNYYAFLPKDPYKSAKEIWQFLRQEFGVKELGVIITDSHSLPLRWGRIGTHLAYCGFEALNDKVGVKDLFGRKLRSTQVGVAEGLAVAAVVEMGETNEARPLAIITQISDITFADHAPTKAEIDKMKISLDDDMYGMLLKAVPWIKNKKPEK